MTAFEIGPGVVAPPTKASRSVSWRESNLMRWVEGKLTPFEGWARTTFPLTASPIRRVFDWRSLDGRIFVAYLCEQHLYVDIAGVFTDITPVGGLTPPPTGVGGYGDWEYSLDTYGTPRPPSNREKLNPEFCLSNWGQDLLAMTSHDGRLLRWSPATPGTRAVAVPNAPINSRAFSVTPERFVVLFDYDSKMGTFAWCSRENIEDWVFGNPLTTAGDLPVFPASPHHSSILVPGGVLAFSQKSAYIVKYVGGTFVQGFDIVDETGNIPMSDRSVVSTPAGAVWLSKSGAWRFDGVTAGPIDCPVWDWINKYCDFDVARFTAAAIHNPSRSEIMFFFPSKGLQKNDRYVLYSYKEGWWATGRMARSAGIVSSYYAKPIMADDRKVYQHETGNTYLDSAELPWIESYSITAGSVDLTFQYMEPDLEGQFEAVRFSLRYRNSLSRGKEIATPLRRVINDRVEFMTAVRECRLRVQMIENRPDKWTMGNSEIYTKAITKK